MSSPLPEAFKPSLYGSLVKSGQWKPTSSKDLGWIMSA